MSDELVEFLVEQVQQMEWPARSEISVRSQNIYEQGIDILNSARADPEPLFEALQVFQATDSRPYAYAGIAYTLMKAAYQQSRDYDEDGLQEAQRWLEQAQALAPDRVEINFLKAILHLNRKQLKDSRVVLDDLQKKDSSNYFVCLTEMRYWEYKGDIKQVEFWYERAINAADNDSRRINVLNALARAYMHEDHPKEAIRAYQQLTSLTPDDPWLWHNLSICHYNVKQYKEAEACNEKALSLADFPAARYVAQEIKAKRRWRFW